MKEIVLRGSPISKGIGIGFPVFLNVDGEISEECVPKKEVEEEIHRYRNALDLSRKDLESLQRESLEKGHSEVALILESHLEMMKDPFITSGVEKKVRETGQNIEVIFHHLIDEYRDRFNLLKDSYFRERIRDIEDVSQRILGHLRPFNRMKLSDVPHNSVILADELVPSETVEANVSLVSAFVTESGGLTSHAAIVARAKGIPYVANVDLKFLKNGELKSLIVDGSQGIIIINPEEETLKKYEELKKRDLEETLSLTKDSHLKSETIDGYEVRVFANLENPQEIDQILQNGAFGIGLFRSEYLFLSKRLLPTEGEQFKVYQEMLQNLNGKPLVIRVFDLGGDKKVSLPLDHPDMKYFLDLGHETNPVLGCRAIRFLLRYPEILEAQLRAIVRASRYGDIHILIPMVSDISEIRFVRQKILEIQEEFMRKKETIAKIIPIGCMIEVPSSALMCDVIAHEVDFLSIGTNDLIQYVLAADRVNPYTSHLYFAIHPSILRLIRMVVSFAKIAKKPVCICGEMATDPLIIPILVGLGVTEFSVAARFIPLVKHTVRKWRILEACRLAEGALELSSFEELRRYLSQEVSTR